MATPKFHEEVIYRLVEKGYLTIDLDGRIWLHRYEQRSRWTPDVLVVRLPKPRRAEKPSGKDGAYLQVRATIDGTRYHALAHRLVWRQAHGPIPAGLTINHENGMKSDNRLENLTLATNSEQQLHALHTLGVGRLTEQWGTANRSAVLTSDQVRMIRERRTAGELLRSIATDFGVTQQTISRIARGDRRSRG